MRTLHRSALCGRRLALVLLGLSALPSLAGCRAADLGTTHTAQQAERADTSWIQAARSCWPGLDATDSVIVHNLIDPEHMRTIFGSYANLSDASLRTIVGRPMMDASEPDDSTLLRAQTPVLTRRQALDHVDPHSIRRAENGAPDDALCSIQSGTPIGFK